MHRASEETIEACAFPGPLFSLAAFCVSDFDRIAARLGATPDADGIISFGRRIDAARHVYLRLPGGRYASLGKRDSQREIEIGLQRDGHTFYQDELDGVLAAAGIHPEAMERYENPPIQWAASRPRTPPSPSPERT